MCHAIEHRPSMSSSHAWHRTEQVAYPAITMIKSQKCDADEQGRVMGSLSAAMQLANGIGVLFFCHAYAWLIRVHPEPDQSSLDEFKTKDGTKPELCHAE